MYKANLQEGASAGGYADVVGSEPGLVALGRVRAYAAKALGAGGDLPGVMTYGYDPSTGGGVHITSSDKFDLSQFPQSIRDNATAAGIDRFNKDTWLENWPPYTCGEQNATVPISQAGRDPGEFVYASVWMRANKYYPDNVPGWTIARPCAYCEAMVPGRFVRPGSIGYVG